MESPDKNVDRHQLNQGDCPKVPDSEVELKFKREKMTRWFHPKTLLKLAYRTLAAKLVLSYIDRRSVMAALKEHKVSNELKKLAKEEEVWIDYVADLGDGWNSTYAVARTLASVDLKPDKLDESEGPLKRGQILVMGGDQVYPVAETKAYRNRLKGPYQSALPCIPEADAPRLFAIPANHDWYDGLKSFSRLFLQKAWIGGWKTEQSRSYFAIQLPHGWWIWGIDTQLDAYIDIPQQEYFRSVAASKAFRYGDRVVLCIAEPAWIYAHEGNGDLHRNIEHLEDDVINPHGGQLVATLSGDLHHYARYKEVISEKLEKKKILPQQKITCGGGGAYMNGTHHLPESIEVKQHGKPASYKLGEKSIFPDRKKSQNVVWRNLYFPFLNPEMAMLLGFFFLLNAWVLQASSYGHGQSLLSQLSNLPFSFGHIGPALRTYLSHLVHSPLSIILTLIFIVSLIFFAKPAWHKHVGDDWGRRIVLGGLHALLHLLLLAGLLWCVARLNAFLFHHTLSVWLSILTFSVEFWLIASLLNGFIFGLYLAVTNSFLKYHRTEAFSSLRIEDYKCFLRMRVNSQGLTIFPIGISSVPRKWRFRPKAKPGEHWFDSDDGEIVTQMIEQPIKLG